MKRSSSVRGLRPPFPSKTFPSHLTAVTGVYPDKHGIVGNRFFDPKTRKAYSFRNDKAVADGSFYSGTPLWNLAVKQGMVSATYFWPGSEAKIGGYRPTYWMKYDHGVKHQERIDQVVNWFSLPEKKRPHFVTLYMHDVDSAGHKYGPLAPMTKSAVQKVDRSLNKLFSRISALKLDINIIIISDHGMTQLDPIKKVVIRPMLTKHEKKLLKHFNWLGKGPIIQLHLKEHKNKKYVKKLIDVLKRKKKYYRVFTRESIPKSMHFNRSPRFGDILLLADLGASIYIDDPKKSKRRTTLGNHGYDPYSTSDMNGIFIAHGPQIRVNYKINNVVDNIHLYPLIASLLNLKVPENIDGELSVLKNIRRLPMK